jgi:hypothetical protein
MLLSKASCFTWSSLLLRVIASYLPSRSSRPVPSDLFFFHTASPRAPLYFTPVVQPTSPRATRHHPILSSPALHMRKPSLVTPDPPRAAEMRSVPRSMRHKLVVVVERSKSSDGYCRGLCSTEGARRRLVQETAQRTQCDSIRSSDVSRKEYVNMPLKAVRNDSTVECRIGK